MHTTKSIIIFLIRIVAIVSGKLCTFMYAYVDPTLILL